MKKFLLYLLLSFSLVFFVACSNQQNRNFSGENIKAELIRGKTTKEKVMEFFGKPSMKIKNDDGGESWVYNSKKKTNTSFGLGLGLGLFSIGPLSSSIGLGTSVPVLQKDGKVYVIIFDKNGYYKEYRILEE